MDVFTIGDMVKPKPLYEEGVVSSKKRRISEKLAVLVLLLDVEASGTKDIICSRLVSTVYHTVHGIGAAREALRLFKPDLILVEMPVQQGIDITFMDLPTVLLVDDSNGGPYQLTLPKGCNDYILLSELSDPVLRWTESRARRVAKPPPSSAEHLAKMLEIVSRDFRSACWITSECRSRPIYVAESCAQLLNRSVEELRQILASPLQQDNFVHPNDVEKYEACMQEGLHPGGKADFCCRILMSCGSGVRSVRFHVESHEDGSNNTVHYGYVSLPETKEDLTKESIIVLKDRSNLEQKCACYERDDCSCECTEEVFPGQSRKRNLSRSIEEEKLAKRNRSLELSLAAIQKESGAKSRFVEFVSHEVRTLMGAIVGAAELFDTKSLATLERKYLDMIKTSSNSILHVLDDVLTFAKMEAGMVQIKPGLFNLRNFVDELAFTYKTKSKEVAFRYKVGEEVPATIKADSVRLRQVLSNLLNNAYKFTSNGFVELAIDAQKRDKNVVKLRFSVSDTGRGIARDALATLFDPFTQVDDSASTNGKLSRLGTGLGLNISKTLVELMGGSLDVQSTYAKGSAFSFAIEVEYPGTFISNAAVDSSAPSPSTTEKRTQHFPSLQVLVADDDRLGQVLLKRMLTRLGCSVDVVNNGEEAVQSIRKKSGGYDLVLMDCDMPVVDGCTAASEIRKWESQQHKQRTLIYACTAHVLQSNVSSCLSAGMDSYLTKPVRLEDLRKACDNAVSR